MINVSGFFSCRIPTNVNTFYHFHSVPVAGWMIEEDINVTTIGEELLCSMNFPNPQPSDIITTYNIRASLGSQVKVGMIPKRRGGGAEYADFSW